MCNVYSLDAKEEMSLQEFKKIINDDIFREIEAVGINGGEPFLCPNLFDFVMEIVKKPKIKALNIITNGFLSEIILRQLKDIYAICNENDIKFHISFSLDGYKEVHDKVRGVIGAFERTIQTINEIEKNKELYCDSYDIGCTVVKQNVEYLIELDTFVEKNSFNIKYRLGIENLRLYNEEKKSSYSIFNDLKARQSATEFFYSRIFKEENIYDKFKYYAIFKYLLDDNSKRKLGCDWRQNGITLDSKGNIYYCAVKSPCIANLKTQKGEKAFFSENALLKRREIIEKECMHCIHDYFGNPSINDVLDFIKFLYLNRFWIKQFRR